MKSSPFLMVALVLASLATGSGQIRLRPGQYETTADMDFAGTKMTQKDSECFTAEDLKDFSAKALMKMFEQENEEKACSMSEPKTNGNKITFSSVCEIDGLKMTSTGEMTLAAESWTGVVTMRDNKGRTTTIKTTGKRIGECTR